MDSVKGNQKLGQRLTNMSNNRVASFDKQDVTAACIINAPANLYSKDFNAEKETHAGS